MSLSVSPRTRKRFRKKEKEKKKKKEKKEKGKKRHQQQQKHKKKVQDSTGWGRKSFIPIRWARGGHLRSCAGVIMHGNTSARTHGPTRSFFLPHFVFWFIVVSVFFFVFVVVVVVVSVAAVVGAVGSVSSSPTAFPFGHWQSLTKVQRKVQQWNLDGSRKLGMAAASGSYTLRAQLLHFRPFFPIKKIGKKITFVFVFFLEHFIAALPHERITI